MPEEAQKSFRKKGNIETFSTFIPFLFFFLVKQIKNIYSIFLCYV